DYGAAGDSERAKIDDVEPAAGGGSCRLPGARIVCGGGSRDVQSRTAHKTYGRAVNGHRSSSGESGEVENLHTGRVLPSALQPAIQDINGAPGKESIHWTIEPIHDRRACRHIRL